MTYASWEPRFRVTTVQPGAADVLVVTLIDGKRAALQPITEYEDALVKARAFHRDHRCQIKVLPLTGPEVRNLFNLGAPTTSDAITPAERQVIISRLRDIARDSADCGARGGAFDLLTEMGAFLP